VLWAIPADYVLTGNCGAQTVNLADESAGEYEKADPHFTAGTH